MGRNAWIVAALFAAACSSSSGGGGSSGHAACVDGDADCGKSCSALQPCSRGLYCTKNGVCAKDCVAPAPHKESAHACAGGKACSAAGQCITTSSGSGGSNEIPGGHANNDSGIGSGMRPDATAAPPPGTACADQHVYTSRVTPTVILIVDQSGSMNDDFSGAGSRWNVLRDFLLQQPNGLIDDLQKQVRFGLALYSARSAADGGSLPEGECPIVTTVPPALDNFNAIASVYRANEPIDDTPTGDSIDKVVEDLHLATDPDTKKNPVVFVLATDGEPDRCEQLDPQTDEGKMEAVDAVTRAFKLGIRTFVISVGNEVGKDHQQAIANAGLGHTMGDPNAEYWVAGDDKTLRQALTDIVGAQLGCEVTLKGKVTGGDPCKGRVTLNGNDLECNGADGWQLSDPMHIKLIGSACMTLKSSDEVDLQVTFPCDVPIVE